MSNPKPPVSPKFAEAQEKILGVEKAARLRIVEMTRQSVSELIEVLTDCPEQAPRMLTAIERIVNTNNKLLSVLGHEVAPFRRKGQLNVGNGLVYPMASPGYAPLPPLMDTEEGGLVAAEAADPAQDRETFGVNAFGQMMAQQQQTEAPKKLAALMSAYKDAKASGLLDVAEQLEGEIREQTAIVTRQKAMPKDARVALVAKTFDEQEGYETPPLSPIAAPAIVAMQ